MQHRRALITGSGGEMGRLLVPALAQRGYETIAFDLAPAPAAVVAAGATCIEGNITDARLMQRVIAEFRPSHVFHLAAVLSTRAERDPFLAHRVNVTGTAGLLELLRALSREQQQSVRFLFPSSIAVYGLPDARTRTRVGAIAEHEWNRPAGVYGCNKLYCEMLGQVLWDNDRRRGEIGVDFRAIRFPGLISAESVPSGGTTDYGPEMIHAAARGESYTCFVNEDTRLPFMTMTDAIDGFIRLAQVAPERLTRRVYNIRSFSPSAREFRDQVVSIFPRTEISFVPDAARQRLVDSWPADVDDSPARHDWGFRPHHGLEQAFAEYLVPALRVRYGPAPV